MIKEACDIKIMYVEYVAILLIPFLQSLSYHIKNSANCYTNNIHRYRCLFIIVQKNIIFSKVSINFN